jgi:dipeptidyl aminopeptidase/acylaminoacyl peptidase
MLEMYKTNVSLSVVSCLVAVLASDDLPAAESDTKVRHFEVRDSVELARFTEPGLISPDGEWAVVVTHRGLLPDGDTEATLWLFDAQAIRQLLEGNRSPASVAPTPLVRMAAAINGDGGDDFGKIIMRIAWESGSNSILFLGRDDKENRQLFRVNIEDEQATPLTPETQDVVDYAVASKVIAYLAGPDVAAETLWWSNDPGAADIVNGTGQPLSDLLYPGARLNNRFMPTEFELWQINGARAEPLIDDNTGQPMRVVGSYYRGAMSLARDGKRLVATTHAERVPASWQKYEVPTGLDGEPFQVDTDPAGDPVPVAKIRSDYTRALQYQLVDLENGSRRPLVDAPVADFLRGGTESLQAAWSPDGSLVMVTEIFPPLGNSKGGDAPVKRCRLAVVTVLNNTFDCLHGSADHPMDAIVSVEWDDSGRLPLIRFADDSALTFDRRDTGWYALPERRLALAEFDLVLEQGLNEPPVLVAKNPRASKSLKVFDPNPQLAGIALGEVSVYLWKTPRGLEAFGGLAKPPDFSTDRRYPLVIQTHGFPRDQFFTTGLRSNTASAGRALAARGMLVLQVREPRSDSDGTWREATERGTEVYLAAIDQLVREGLVDPAKVGIAGYSRQGAFVAKAISEAPERFAAAVVANTLPGSVFGYYTLLDDRSNKVMRDYAEFQAGALPYGDGLEKWFERAAGFRTERIRAPVLVSAGDPIHLIALWPLYAPLRDQGKPVELQYMRSGTHNFIKPLQVLAHQEMLVDWFDFWLNDHEDEVSAKAAQYARWREMKSKQLRK